MLLFLFLAALGGIGYVVVTRYNALQRLAEVVREAHANVMASMKKRIDLTNQLVDVVRSYTTHEQLTHITVSSHQGDGGLIAAGANVRGVLAQVGRLATSFPELKADSSYRRLMAEQGRLEEDLQGKREAYNACVRTYNSALTQLPTSLFASSVGFHAAPYFNVENADALENLKNFQTDDGTMVRELLAQGGRRVAAESARLGRAVVEKGKEVQAQVQAQAAQRAAANGAASAPGAAPAPTANPLGGPPPTMPGGPMAAAELDDLQTPAAPPAPFAEPPQPIVPPTAAPPSPPPVS